MKAAGDRGATGREDGGESRSEKQRGRGIMGEFAAGIRSFTSDGEPGDVPSWDDKGKFNFPSLMSQPGCRNTWRWRPKLPNR